MCTDANSTAIGRESLFRSKVWSGIARQVQLDATGGDTRAGERGRSGRRGRENATVGRPRSHAGRGRGPCTPESIYGALDLGTNNCRLLVARPTARGFRVVDAFSRIIRLGEGLQRTGALSQPAMDRAIDALKICTDKMIRRNVMRSRLIATEACRQASNGAEFVERVRVETGLRLEIIDRETEARLAVAGSAALLDRECDAALVFDIGGGSSELMWLSVRPDGHHIEAWTSLPVGVVTLAESFGGVDVTGETFEAMVAAVMPMLCAFDLEHDICRTLASRSAHLLGTSGTVTTIAGVHLGLERYDRSKVDGCWLGIDDIQAVTEGLLRMSHDERAASPCIGHERADLVLAGCAILEGIKRVWPCTRVRVADRGLREGILTTLMVEDGVLPTTAICNPPRRPGRRRRRRSSHRRVRPHSD